MHTKKRGIYQCPHHNTGFCRFREECRYPHYYTICKKTICRNEKCQNRHPKSCRSKENCNFFQRNVCAYKHDIDVRPSDQYEALQDKVKSLNDEISKLKEELKIKQNEIQEKSIDIFEMKEKLILIQRENDIQKARVNDMEIKITELEAKNEVLRNENNLLTADFSCDKCHFKAKRLKEFLVHMKAPHGMKKKVLISVEKVKGPLLLT